MLGIIHESQTQAIERIRNDGNGPNTFYSTLYISDHSASGAFEVLSLNPLYLADTNSMSRRLLAGTSHNRYALIPYTMEFGT
jgi:hypothetical protein